VFQVEVKLPHEAAQALPGIRQRRPQHGNDPSPPLQQIA
jgi:hypothetical protein